ncbi:MAG: cytochrome c biogenesis heme-transporting ATPase CcmA [Gammaproteobacteria bacterium]|nr:cytochrome c biogenesis heme-transporting ATPase CcmA [Gammaproteobacteria bacterium]
MLSVVDLECVRGDRRLFSALNFSLGEGEVLHLRGRNGSGKTTLLRTLCGLSEPEQGEIRWRDEKIGALAEGFCREVLYLGHLNAVKGDLTAVENLSVAAQLDGDDLAETQIWDALQEVGLRGYEDLPVRVLSQGQKRRVALARLLLTTARLWILDEPFVALDSAAVEQLREVIERHVAQGGLVVLTTHQEIEWTSGRVQEIELDA